MKGFRFRLERLRHVAFDGYRLATWDTHERCSTGQWRLAYAMWDRDGKLLFHGRDYGCAPSDSIDSDESLRGLLGFLLLRPGDTDSEYFSKYSERQLDFARNDAENLCFWRFEASDYESGEGPEAFEDLS